MYLITSPSVRKKTLGQNSLAYRYVGRKLRAKTAKPWSIGMVMTAPSLKIQVSTSTKILPNYTTRQKLLKTNHSQYCRVIPLSWIDVDCTPLLDSVYPAPYLCSMTLVDWLFGPMSYTSARANMLWKYLLKNKVNNEIGVRRNLSRSFKSLLNIKGIPIKTTKYEI